MIEHTNRGLQLAILSSEHADWEDLNNLGICTATGLLDQRSNRLHAAPTDSN